MQIKVIGKSHLEGVSRKTNQPYNFNQVHFVAPAQGVEGMAAQVQALDPAIFPYDRIQIGGEYSVEYNNRGYVVAFTPVTK